MEVRMMTGELTEDGEACRTIVDTEPLFIGMSRRGTRARRGEEYPLDAGYGRPTPPVALSRRRTYQTIMLRARGSEEQA
jgi:hypothetical protein